jgi:DNA repair exonuclease SbcCD nuclease subunit
MTARFIHTADWQIGKNFDRIADNAKRERLRRARIDSVARIGVVAREKGADFVLVAGDLFDSPTSDKSTLAAGLGAIGQLELPVIAIPGNHDHAGPGGFWELDFFKDQQRALAPNFTVLLQQAPLETDTAYILPCPLLRRSDPKDPTVWLRQHSFEEIEQSGKPVVLLAHGSTQTFAGTGYDDEESDKGASNLIELRRLPADLVDYVALGDWHGTKMIEPWAWYSGTHEPDRFTKGGDHDPGNVLFVECQRGTVPVVEKIRTASVDWHSKSFTLAGHESLGLFRAQLDELLGSRVDADLLQLDLDGTLGLGDSALLESVLDGLEARLIRLKMRNSTRLEATTEEIETLTTRGTDPLIARVARTLIEKMSAPGEESAVAASALQELFAAARQDGSPA